MQDVSGVFMLLAMPNAELRSSAAVVVVNLLGEQGREALEAAAERLKVEVLGLVWTHAWGFA
jgi:flagellar biosynthesis/type III secretory pathway ATPase